MLDLKFLVALISSFISALLPFFYLFTFFFLSFTSQFQKYNIHDVSVNPVLCCLIIIKFKEPWSYTII